MNRPAYTLLKKIVRMRTYLLNNKIGKRNLELVNKLDKIAIWVNAWPNAPEHGCINYMKQHYNDLMMLLPSCKAADKLVAELNTLTK
jgi:hypothetical protein